MSAALILLLMGGPATAPTPSPAPGGGIRKKKKHEFVVVESPEELPRNLRTLFVSHPGPVTAPEIDLEMLTLLLEDEWN